ncbi:MAG: diaminopimelate epimerase [Coriobacteriia bacterium]|nr:diaminopimelate epimerase [Coriobacteriia bacterium]
MELFFTKMHGTGNDFVFIDDLSQEIELSTKQVQLLCDRNLGIGADGVILVRPSEHADCVAYMHYINNDGSLAEMCGNGVRCFAKYLVDKGFVETCESCGKGSFIADTLAGKRSISFTMDDEGLLLEASVDMGEPAFAPEDIPTTLAATSVVVRAALVDGEEAEEPAVVDAMLDTPLGELAFTCVNMGNPHAVTFFGGADDTVTGLDIRDVGPLLVQHEAFPKQANIEFAQVLQQGSEAEPAEIRLRVCERGVGETLACGTGTCATVVAAVVTGRIATRKALVHLPGGDLLIEWLANNHVRMTGPAVTVYEGTITL